MHKLIGFSLYKKYMHFAWLSFQVCLRSTSCFTRSRWQFRLSWTRVKWTKKSSTSSSRETFHSRRANAPSEYCSFTDCSCLAAFVETVSSRYIILKPFQSWIAKIKKFSKYFQNIVPVLRKTGLKFLRFSLISSECRDRVTLELNGILTSSLNFRIKKLDFTKKKNKFWMFLIWQKGFSKKKSQ